MTVKSFTLVKKEGTALGVRHLQVFFLFTCCSLAFQQRINVSVAVVAMTNANSTNPAYAEYELTEPQKSYMLSSIFWGTISSQLLAGYLSSQYGTKLPLFCCTLGTSLLSFCLPLAMDRGGWFVFCLLRLLQGFCQGFMWPCFYAHLAKWCPASERNRLGGITQTGMDVGTALGFATSGLLAASPLGWPSMFYVPAAFGLIWCILWLVYGADSPAHSKIITPHELKHIAQSLEQSAAHSRRKMPVPWCSIFTSLPYMVLLVCKITQACSYLTLMQQIPLFIHGIFNFDIKVNALLSALPFAFMCLMSYVFLIAAEVLTKGELASLSVVRKTINTVASWIPAVAFVVLGHLSADNVVGSMVCLVVAVAACSAQAIGSSLNHIDLAPNFAGVLYGISNTMMNCMGIFSPIVVGVVVKDLSDRSQWRIIFLGIAVILFVGNLLYIIFGKMVVQPWNEPTSAAADEAPKVISSVALDFPRITILEKT